MNFKKQTLLILIAFSLFSCGQKNNNTEQKVSSIENSGASIKIKGSETVLPITQMATEAYMKEHPESQLIVTGGGSGVGLSALLAGTTDIAQTSRSIKFDEKQKIKEAGNVVKEVVIAYDALAIIVNPNNQISQLTREQLEGIFTGKIKNWKELGGDDMEIVPYARETSSGTYEFFKESVLNNKNHMAGIMSMPANGAIIQSISQTKGAIAYVGLAYLNPKVKALKVSYDEGQNYVEPSFENAKNKLYPIIRPLFYYYLEQSESKVRPFIAYLLSDAGQEIVDQVGYVDLK